MRFSSHVLSIPPDVSVAPVLATSTFELTLRMGVALTVILGILYLASKVARRHLHHRGADRPQIDVQYQRQLTKQATISLVRAGNRNLLIATNNQAITLLAEGDDLAPNQESVERFDGSSTAKPGQETNIDVRSSSPVANPIKALQNRTVRRG